MNDTIKILTPEDWAEYELIDSGDEEKLERFGYYTFVRPEPKALWHKNPDRTIWEKADAVYKRSSSGGGTWNYPKEISRQWIMHRKNLSFLVKPTGFKHMGFFPEQAVFWDLITQKISSQKKSVSLLNLFAYTGGSTLAAAAAGASVTHIDSSKEVVSWARENAKLSKLEDKPIRWIPEDVMTFVKREIKRSNSYDAIILDPPKFGRGVNNEVWKIEEDLPKLLDMCMEILSSDPLFIIINAYAVSYSSLTLGNMLIQLVQKYKGRVYTGELGTKHSSNQTILPNSIFGVWEKQ